MPHSQVNSAFGARWLARSEVIIQLYSSPSNERRAKLQKSIIFLFIFTDKAVFRDIFSTYVVHTKTIIHLDVGGYLARRTANIHHYSPLPQWIIVNYNDVINN